MQNKLETQHLREDSVGLGRTDALKREVGKGYSLVYANSWWSVHAQCRVGL